MVSEHARPTIYYLGNKTKTAKFIDSACGTAFGEDSPVLDLFAGSGATARQFAFRRKVVSNDIQAYSQILCSALLKPYGRNDEQVISAVKRAERLELGAGLKQLYTKAIRLEREIAGSRNPELINQYCDELGEIRGISATSPNLITYYGGLYFSVEQACELQALADLALTLHEAERDYLRAGLISAASRLSFTVGNQFAQPLRWLDRQGNIKISTLRKFASKQKYSATSLVLECLYLFSGIKVHSSENICLKMTDIEAVRNVGESIGFVYADPPYGREHYSRFYHVLETIARGDFPSIANQETMIGTERYQSRYSIRSKAVDAFEQLLRTTTEYGLPIALSYADDSGGDKIANRVLSINQIMDIISSHYSDIKCLLASDRNYSQLNSAAMASGQRKNSEFLILAR